MTQFEDFIGKSAEVLFETGFHFKLDYLTTSELRWTSLREEDNGSTEMETIYVHDLGNGKINVNWIESTGISVTHIIDIDEGIVWAFMNWTDEKAYGNRAVLTHSGTFKFI